jgi:branched-chain amino acid transport system permease protein
MHEFLIFTISGLTTAGIYAITASGLTLTYVTTGVFNMAHGATGALAAFTYWQLKYAWHWPTLVALLFVVVVLAPIYGIVVERLLFRRLEGTSDATKLVVTTALLAATLALLQLVWKPDRFRSTQELYSGHKISFFGVDVPYNDLIVLAVAAAVAIGLRILLYKTRIGVSMRATVDDQSLSVLNGSSPHTSAQTAWAIGTSLAAIAGILVAPKLSLSAIALTLLIINAYAAAVVGRLRSLPMTFVGALIVGLANDYAIGYLPKIATGAQYIQGFLGVVPVAVLLIAILMLPQSRLRGAATLRHREVSVTPTWRGGLLFVGCVIAGTFLVLPLVSSSDLFSSTQVWGLAIIGLSFVPLVGYAGRLSLCQLAFAAIGAVTVAHMGSHGALPALLLAAAVSAVVGALISLPALRVSGIYLALLTAAFAVTLDRWIFQLPPFTIFGHQFDLFESGSLTSPPLSLFGISLSGTKAFFIFGGIVFSLCAFGVIALRRSDIGQRLVALKDSPAACATLGMNPRVATLSVFTLSAGIAGLGGALYGTSLQSSTPDSYTFFTGLSILLVVVVFGVSSVGSALAAGVLIGAPLAAHASSTSSTQLQAIIIAGAAMLLGGNPNGLLAGIVKPQAAKVSRRPALLAGGLAVAAALYLLRLGGVIDGWILIAGFAALAVGLPMLADQRSGRADRDSSALVTPLDWIGLDEPFPTEDIIDLDRRLALPEVPHAVV